MRRIVQVESSFNPYAIGVVGARLQRQPRSFAEAMATIGWLDANGYNYSVGLGQVNKHNFSAYGLNASSALAACPNLRAAGAILTACFARARESYHIPQAALRAAFSCYESGNFRTGFLDGYVLKILGASEPPAATTIAIAIAPDAPDRVRPNPKSSTCVLRKCRLKLPRAKRRRPPKSTDVRAKSSLLFYLQNRAFGMPNRLSRHPNEHIVNPD